ncbi:pro-opiomelanocortin-like [Aulostomus maculatus]
MCPAWLLVAVVFVGVARGAVSQCWEHPSCQELDSESNIMECMQLCHADLYNETPVVPGDAHLLPSPPSDPSSTPAKRSYSMEHFRWGKPVGRKRRPVKVYTSNSVEEESAEVFPGEVMRRELANQDRPEEVPEDVQKKDESYKMSHFRWGSPPTSKRYEGTVKGWDQQSQQPLMALFKNAISKDGHTQE